MEMTAQFSVFSLESVKKHMERPIKISAVFVVRTYPHYLLYVRTYPLYFMYLLVRSKYSVYIRIRST